MKKIINNFINNAIQNGYDNDGCNGWDWIRDNLSQLYFIWKSEDYKKENGMKYKCMPFIIKNNKKLSELETRVLETAWYLNNQREHENKKEAKIKKLNDEGFFNIESDQKLDNKKIEFIVDNTSDMFGRINQYQGKLKWSYTDSRLMAMKTRCRTRGYWVDNKDIYIKLLNK